MIQADKDEFVTHLQALAAAYRVEPTTAWITAYWLALQDLPLDAVRRSLINSLAQCRYMPSPADIRATAGASGSEDRALLAVGRVIRAISSVGRYQSVDLGDPIAHAAVRAVGGWVRVCDTPEDEIKWLQRDLIAQYRLLDRVSCDVDGSPLLGLTARQRQSEGYELPEPMRLSAGHLRLQENRSTHGS